MKTTLIAGILLLLAATATAQNIEKRPAAPAFSQKAVEAYEVKAESKVNEFFGYLTLLTDPAGDAEMKKQASADAVKLFRDDKVLLQDFFDTKGRTITLKQLLEKAEAQEKKVDFSTMSFATIPKLKSDLRYDWLMSYEVIVGNRAVKVSQSFSIVYEDKKFGNSTKKVWNSYLGELR